MGIRPRTAFKKKLKARRCGKCGAKVNTLVTRCKRCSAALSRPKA